MLLLISIGASTGWNSPSFLELTSDQSHLETGPITYDEMSWIASLVSPGGIVGTQVFGMLLSRFGAKKSITVSALIQTVRSIMF